MSEKHRKEYKAPHLKNLGALAGPPGPPEGLLYRRGSLVLNGSCVGGEKGAVAFLGHSEWSKSIAAAMRSEGYRSITDDVLVVDEPGGKGPARVFCDAAPEPVPLVGVYVIEEVEPQALRGRGDAVGSREAGAAGQPAIQPLEAREAVTEAIRHSYCVGKSADSEAGVHLDRCALLVENVPFKRLWLARDAPTAADLIPAIIEDLSRLRGKSP